MGRFTHFCCSFAHRARTLLLVSPCHILGVAACGIGLTFSTAAGAAGEELARTEPPELAVGVGASILLTGGAFLLPSPRACRWCEPPAIDRWLHSPVAARSRRPVAFASHVISFGVLPVGGLSSVLIPPLLGVGEPRHVVENNAIFVEALLTNLALTVAVKKWAARRRPAFYYGRGGLTEFAESPERYLSFFSGDTSMAFVSASTASTISFLRGYRAAPYVAAGSGALALTAGLMRIGADVHWPSDVFAGAVMGTAVGVLVPVFVHPRRNRAPVAHVDRASRMSSPSAPLLQLGGSF